MIRDPELREQAMAEDYGKATADVLSADTRASIEVGVGVGVPDVLFSCVGRR